MAKKKTGRPSSYKTDFCKVAHNLAQQGATDREIADSLKVSEATVHRWKHEHPEFRESLKMGKDAADERVVQSLYRRAVGYSFDSVHIAQYQGAPVVIPYVEHVPPDTTAAIFWLKNRRREEWRDRVDIDANVGLHDGEVKDRPLTAEEWEAKHGVGAAGGTPARAH